MINLNYSTTTEWGNKTRHIEMNVLVTKCLLEEKDRVKRVLSQLDLQVK